ncbi:MAG TPA: SCO family protein [Solirubrobacteraceae bacterium]|jgi:protein SCO1/2|nr:SCO family protein [Solirubrobacteraceae bacterium]
MTDPSTHPSVDDEPAAAAAADVAPPSRTPRPAWRTLLPVVVLLVVIAGLALVLVTPSKPAKTPLPGGVAATGAGAGADGAFDGQTLTPVKPAPPTTLRNYLGQTVSLAQYRGKAVFVTFLYTHCPDVCPLIASNLHATQAALGPENAKVQMLAISVDPKGDTPSAVATFLRVHRLVGRMQYLVGSAAQLGRVWAAWNVGSEQDAGSPELVDHTALVYGISAKGDVTTIYPPSFKPSDLVHDTPLLVGR